MSTRHSAARMAGQPDPDDTLAAERAQALARRQAVLGALNGKRQSLLARGISGVPEITGQMSDADMLDAGRRLAAIEKTGSATAPTGRFTTASGQVLDFHRPASPVAFSSFDGSGASAPTATPSSRLVNAQAVLRATLERGGARNLPQPPPPGASDQARDAYHQRLLGESQAQLAPFDAATAASAASTAASTNPVSSAINAATGMGVLRGVANDSGAAGRAAAATPPAPAFTGFASPAPPLGAVAPRPVAPPSTATAAADYVGGKITKTAFDGMVNAGTNYTKPTGPVYASERGPNYITSASRDAAIGAAGGGPPAPPTYGLISSRPITNPASIPAAPTRPTLDPAVGRQIVAQNPAIGVAGSDANKAFLASYNGIDDPKAAGAAAATVGRQFPASPTTGYAGKPYNPKAEGDTLPPNALASLTPNPAAPAAAPAAATPAPDQPTAQGFGDLKVAERNLAAPATSYDEGARMRENALSTANGFLDTIGDKRNAITENVASGIGNAAGTVAGFFGLPKPGYADPETVAAREARPPATPVADAPGFGQSVRAGATSVSSALDGMLGVGSKPPAAPNPVAPAPASDIGLSGDASAKAGVGGDAYSQAGFPSVAASPTDSPRSFTIGATPRRDADTQGSISGSGDGRLAASYGAAPVASALDALTPNRPAAPAPINGKATDAVVTGGLTTSGLTSGGLNTGGLNTGSLTTGGLNGAAPTPGAPPPVAAPVPAPGGVDPAEELRRRMASAGGFKGFDVA